jgi:hypothetical protein
MSKLLAMKGGNRKRKGVAIDIKKKTRGKNAMNSKDPKTCCKNQK